MYVLFMVPSDAVQREEKSRVRRGKGTGGGKPEPMPRVCALDLPDRGKRCSGCSIFVVLTQATIFCRPVLSERTCFVSRSDRLLPASFVSQLQKTMPSPSTSSSNAGNSIPIISSLQIYLKCDKKFE